MLKIITLSLATLVLSGCFLTKIVTVPARVVGAVISVVPIIGPAADSAIDSMADVVDSAPI